ncbi:MAG: outer membrane beta-barrel protein [Sphingobacteriaceae bacterium]|nr:outer membrane beta-barrel protein [Sphingobacteriaceae bacterium]
MKSTLQILILLVLMSSNALFGQMPGGGNQKDMLKMMKDIKGRVYGKVIDAKTKKPVEFASVVLLWYNKDSAIAGGFTEDNGDFNLEGLPAMGGFRLRVTQVGYKTFEQKVYIQAPQKLEQDLGNLAMEIDPKLLNEVEVVAEKATFQMSVDRKVYNVEKDLSVRGGTGLDVLKNVPTITVDGDGNATLREKSVQIFIDGRPTTLTMAQIPADAIERVEVISNPSAKFAADASGGIINIVLKKSKKPGYNGMLMGYAGTQDKYGITGNINVKENPFNISLMYSLNATQTGTTFGYTDRTDYNYITPGNTLDYRLDNSTLSRNRFQFARGSVDYNINNRNNIGISYNFVSGYFHSDDKQNFSSLDNSGAINAWGFRKNLNIGGFTNHTAQLTYRKTYPTANKELTADISYNQGGGPATFTFNTYNSASIAGSVYDFAPVVSTNKGLSGNSMYTAQLDFTNPYADNKKVEAGMRLYRKWSTFDNNIQVQGPTGDFIKDTTQSSSYSIDDMINAAYITYTGKAFWDIGFQGGLRFEQTYYAGKLLDKNISFNYNYPSNKDNILFAFFPSVFLSKKIGTKHEFQFNVSRKIERPNFFQAMPFVFYSDARNYRIGNPALKPELINISEVNYNNVFKKGNFLSSAYVRYHQQPISNYLYQSPGNASVTVNTFANGRDQWRYGFENTLRVNWTKKFTTTLNADVFYVYLNSGIIDGQPETVSQGWSYKGKVGLNYTLPWSLQLQVNGNYEAPKAILNGQSRELYFMDVSLNKMVNMKWIFNLTLSDAFNTKQHGYYISTDTYYQEATRRRESRFLRFTITYLFGKFDTSIFKKMGKKGGGGSDMGGQGGDGF